MACSRGYAVASGLATLFEAKSCGVAHSENVFVEDLSEDHECRCAAPYGGKLQRCERRMGIHSVHGLPRPDNAPARGEVLGKGEIRILRERKIRDDDSTSA